jgi:fibronectin-binding autotransporter adhesin
VSVSRIRSSGGSRGASALLVAMLVAGLVVVGQSASASTIDVNCATQSIQAKIDAASGGDTLLVKGICVGNFFLAKSLTIKGNPTATLDGDDAGPVLSITGTHTIHLIGLSVTGGLAASGAGIHRFGGGVLTLNKVSVHDNLVAGVTLAEGGGIFSGGGTLKLTASSVVGNRALASDPASTEADGGGIYSLGPLTLVGSTVSANRATATSFGSTATVQGGGIYQKDAPVSVTSSHVDGNHARSVAASGDQATGGGMDLDAAGASMSIARSTFSGNVLTASSLFSSGAFAGGGAVSAKIDAGTVSGSTFAANQVVASSGAGDSSATGGALQTQVATKLTVTSTRVTGTRMTATAGHGATATGGGLSDFGPLAVGSSSFSTATLFAHGDTGSAAALCGGITQGGGLLSLVRSTADQNHLTATSNPGSAEVSGGGACVIGDVKVVGSTVSRNVLSASTQDGLARSRAGGLFLEGQFSTGTITNSTIASNTLTAKVTGSGSGNSFGGGIETYQPTVLTHTTIARNFVGGAAPVVRQAGGLYIEPTSVPKLTGTILALNTAPSAGGPDCFGTFESDGYNLLGKTVGCTFTAKPTDRLNKDPKLGALADNGGPTRTLALLAGSPALDSIPPAVCAVARDQRGVKRPQGPKCDIGAYERKV